METELDIELLKAYNEFKEKNGLNVSYEDFDKIFHLRDNCLADGFISNDIGFILSLRVVKFLGRWINMLHDLVMPNPHSLVILTETNMYNENDKKEMQKTMTAIMGQVAKYNIIEINKDEKDMSDFINASYKLWNEELKSIVLKYSKQRLKGWEKELKKYDK